MSPSPAIEARPVAEQSATETVASDDAVVFDGKIEGGWGYVGSAYGISLAVLLVYVLVTTVRLRGLEARDGRS